MMILEQFLRMVNPELEVWIREHNPQSAEEAVHLAEVFVSARKGSRCAIMSQAIHLAADSKSYWGEGGYGQAQARSLLATSSLEDLLSRPSNRKLGAITLQT